MRSHDDQEGHTEGEHLSSKQMFTTGGEEENKGNRYLVRIRRSGEKNKIIILDEKHAQTRRDASR